MSSTSEAIAALSELGLPQGEIARQLDLAPTTVSYHLTRLSRTHKSDVPTALYIRDGAEAVEPALCRSHTRGEVARLLAAGVARAEIARRLGISKGTVTYHAHRLAQPINERCARRYDWDAVQRYYDQGHSVRECVEVFGFSSASWTDAVKRGAVVPRPFATPIRDLLVADTYRGRYNVKVRLIKEGLKEERCEHCGLTDWRGKPVTLALHHVNGKRNDNRLENLQLLCPNCHCQTNNFAGRNGRGRGGAG